MVIVQFKPTKTFIDIVSMTTTTPPMVATITPNMGPQKTKATNRRFLEVHKKLIALEVEATVKV